MFAFSVIFFSKSQSRSNCLKSSSLVELSDHLTAFHTRNVCKQDSSGKRTFFWGTIPKVPRDGRDAPFSNVTVPEVILESPAMTDNEVDFPALTYAVVSHKQFQATSGKN